MYACLHTHIHAHTCIYIYVHTLCIHMYTYTLLLFLLLSFTYVNIHIHLYVYIYAVVVWISKPHTMSGRRNEGRSTHPVQGSPAKLAVQGEAVQLKALLKGAFVLDLGAEGGTYLVT